MKPSSLEDKNTDSKFSRGSTGWGIAPAHISEREAVFSKGDLFHQAADFGMGEVRPEALFAALAEAK